MALHIRTATAEDYGPFCALIAQSDAYHAARIPFECRLPPEPTRPREFFDTLVSALDQALLVAEEDGLIVGVVAVALRSSPPHPVAVPKEFAYVLDLAVDPSARRRGVGRALMQAVESWGRRRGAAECRLHVYDFNEPAILLYEQLGYQPLMRALFKAL